MKLFKRVLALTLVCVMVLSLAACDKKSGNESNATYTYNLYMEAGPINWNPHAWEMNNEDEFMTYITMGLVDVSIAEDGETFEWVYEMADSITDITATYADKEKWNITEDYGRVYEIKLNQAAKWQDGTPINADTYVYSMQQLLNPEMKNYRANTYLEGDTAIYNAKAYFNNDKAGQPIYESICDLNAGTYALGIDETDKMYASLTTSTAFWGDTLENAYASYGAAYFTGADGTNYYDVLVAEIGDAEFVPANENIINAIKGICSVIGGGYDEEFMEMLFYANGTHEAVDFSEVGMVKVDDYTILYITQNPVEMFYFLSNATSNWIVKEDLYEAGKSTVEKLTSTNYGTSLETTCSYGPYKLVSFETDKQFVFEKNENWYGYTDGEHEGQYQTTHVKYQIVSDHNTQMQLFNSGALDEVALTSDDMATYRMSDNLLKTDQTYTFRWIFGTDINTLTALEEEANDGANKKVLAYDDFRKAISLSMDRTRLAAEATSAYKPGYFLFNNMYYTDIANDPNSQYRKTPEAMEAILRLYGIEYGEGKTYATVEEAYNAITGYDVEMAKELFQSVYEQAIADGNYTDGQEIHINCMATAASSLTADDVAQQDLMNEFVTAATVGTGFEGKITFTFLAGAQDRYLDVATGKIEMIRGAWGGAAFYPFSTIRVYCEPEYMGGLEAIHESCGWNPSVEKCDVVYDFDGDGVAETVTDTFQNWALSINGSGAYATDADAALAILSYLETGILGAYQCIPWSTETLCTMFSQKIAYATTTYNIMYAYGGIRLMTYNYSDAEWDEYVKSQGGTLSYE